MRRLRYRDTQSLAFPQLQTRERERGRARERDGERGKEREIKGERGGREACDMVVP